MTNKGIVAQAIREMDREEIKSISLVWGIRPEILRRWAYDYPVETEREMERRR